MHNGVFIAIYGETPYVDIHNAYGEGKLIYLRTDEAGYYHYYPTDVTDIGTLLLRYVNGRKLYTVTVLPSDMWYSSYVESQEKLVSGTNIKTVNNNSLLGSGNIAVKDAFVAEYGETSFTEVEDAIIEGKQIYLSKTAAGYSNYYQVSVVQSGGSQLDLFYISRTGLSPASTSVLYHASVTSSDVWSFEDYPLQPKLVSGTNIKTINGTSLLGSGDCAVATYSTTDLTAGTSALTTGRIYLVYE
jgi:hypothetical protein